MMIDTTRDTSCRLISPADNYPRPPLKPQEFLQALVDCAREEGSWYDDITDGQEIEGGLLVTMKDGSKWRVDATRIGGRDGKQSGMAIQ